jgi:hypothetical protein
VAVDSDVVGVDEPFPESGAATRPDAAPSGARDAIVLTGPIDEAIAVAPNGARDATVLKSPMEGATAVVLATEAMFGLGENESPGPVNMLGRGATGVGTGKPSTAVFAMDVGTGKPSRAVFADIAGAAASDAFVRGSCGSKGRNAVVFVLRDTGRMFSTVGVKTIVTL